LQKASVLKLIPSKLELRPYRLYYGINIIAYLCWKCN